MTGVDESINSLPGVGAGLRFRLVENNPINYRIDVGVNETVFYRAVGEAF